MSKKKPATATGVLVINKHEGVTSHTIVSILRRLYDMSQIGHTGTLDPMATGVLPVLLGRAAKASDFVMAEDKEYVAEMTLGVTTDTQDTTGKVISVSDAVPPAEKVYEACRRFVGEIYQIPPMYSAIKIGGRKLCDAARSGEVIEREPRKITVFSVEPERLSEKSYRLKIVCSKGTYVRTLCHDIGEYLGCGAAMSSLCRTRSGPFTLDGAYTTEQIERMPFEERLTLPLPTESLFEGYPEVELGDFFAKLAKSGAAIFQKKIGTSFAEGTAVKIKHRGELIALGKVLELDGASAIKPIKMFVI